MIPPDGYLKAAADLCKKHNVLFIADEVQVGFGRTGTMLCHHHEPGVKPDMVILGKALTGGRMALFSTLFPRSSPADGAFRIVPNVHGLGDERSYGGHQSF